MTVTISVPENMARGVEAFVQSQEIALKVVQDEEADVRVVQLQGRGECDESTLQAGGWIRCSTARELADRLDVSPKKIGRLLDFFDIRIRDCELGCF